VCVCVCCTIKVREERMIDLTMAGGSVMVLARLKGTSVS
jgi:hypothetical protein